MPSSNNKHKLLIITAPSGAGKTTIVHHLLQAFPQLQFSISCCTRNARANEIDGVHYYFISVPLFKEKINNYEFAEYEMVYENKYYGTLHKELETAWAQNKIPLADIDVQGALRLMKNTNFRSCSIFIKTPTIEILKTRLQARGTESADTLAERVKKAAFELQFENNFDYIVVNDVLDIACEEVKKIAYNFISQ